MLSNIQVFLEKNRKWLFGFLLVVIVVPFVFTIGSMPGLVGGKRSHKLRLFGYDLNDRKQQEEVVRNGALSIALQTGNEENAWMESAQGYAFYRLLLLSIARDLRLPNPSESTLGEFIKTRVLFQDKDGQFKPELYNTYLENWKQRFGKAYSLRNLLEEDYRCDQVRSVMMKGGFVLPNESAAFFKNVKATYQLDYIVVKNEEPLPEKVHENALRAYYDAHKAEYQVGQRADVTLLFFENKKYAEAIPNLSEKDFEAYFEAHKLDFKDKDKEPMLKEVHERVKTALETEHMSHIALESASQFVMQVYEKNLVMESEAWKELVDKNDIRCIHSVAPYTRDNIPEKKGLSKEVLRTAFDLNEDHFLSDPVPVKNGVIVVALNKFLPPYLPEMDAVREKVVADVKTDQRKKAFDAKVGNLFKFLQGVKPEQNLSEKGLETKKLENFSLETGFMELSKLLQMQALFAFMKDLNALSLNKWTKAYEGVNDTAILFCCKEKKYPEDLATSEEFKEFEKNFTARQRVQQSETLLREMLEDTMNNSGIIR
jgi:hypothetical protein